MGRVRARDRAREQEEEQREAGEEGGRKADREREGGEEDLGLDKCWGLVRVSTTKRW